ncbi:hypothetical protein ACLGL1_03345 [Peptococcus simiae]|uniref:hypothetical protein n=1 Tax=Peptococcus simiae TaxID=1643805 RepID=UPI00398182B1
MTQPMMEGFKALRQGDRLSVESLFASERTFWLTASIATGFALAELQEGPARLITQQNDDDMLEKFNACLRTGHVDETVFAESKARTLDNMQAIARVLQQGTVFNEHRAVQVCTAFVSYWLFSKLIEMEWERLLAADARRESYIFMDGIIADQDELAIIRDKVHQDQPLYDDEIVYLRSHWQVGREFFRRLQNKLVLLDRGLIPFVSGPRA